MSIKSFLQLIVLSAIWGSSFIFMRILSPQIGPITTSFSRLFIAGLFFLIYYKITSTESDLKKNYKIIAIIALINTAIPFTLYAIAALYIPAAFSSIVNSMSPMFGMIFSILILKQKSSLRNIIGIITGIIGVALITNSSSATLSKNTIYGILLCVVSAMCYGLASVIIKKYACNIKPVLLAGYSQLFASFYLVPLLIFQDHSKVIITSNTVFCILILALVCSALAYLIYYNLVADIGPTKTLTVTFLIPVFSILWGTIFLHEKIYPITIVGMIVVLLGTRLVIEKE